VHQQDRRAAVAGGGHHGLVVGQPDLRHRRRARLAGRGQRAVQGGERVEAAREARVQRDVLGQRAQLRGGPAVVQRGHGVGLQLRFGAAERGQHRDGGQLPVGPGQLGAGHRPAEAERQQRLVQLRRAVPHRADHLFRLPAHQGLELLPAPALLVHVVPPSWWSTTLSGSGVPLAVARPLL
jgi:hypothetical protein